MINLSIFADVFSGEHRDDPRSSEILNINNIPQSVWIAALRFACPRRHLWTLQRASK
jgi:hypothetical protein